MRSSRWILPALGALGLLLLAGGCSKDKPAPPEQAEGSIGAMKGAAPTDEEEAAPPPPAPPPPASTEPSGPVPAPPAAATAGSIPPAAPPAAPPVAPDRKALARQILEQSLNSTVEEPERFIDAPLYDLTMDIDYELFTYSATERLHFVNQEADTLRELSFLVYPNSPELTQPGARNLALDEVLVRGQPVRAELDGAHLRVPLPKPLAPGEEIEVNIAFRGHLVRLQPGATDLRKLAFEQLMQLVMGGEQAHGGYGIFSYSDNIVSLGLWYPVLAAYDEHGWDLKPGTGVGDVSYFDISNYRVKVRAPSDVTVISTGVETSRSEASGEAETTFVAGAVREVAMQMSRDYDSEEAYVDGVKIRSWFLRTDRASGREVLQTAREALKVFNEVFGAYPYTELDLVEAPLIGGAGGVEFPGMVTVAKMFYVPDLVANDDPVAQVMASSAFMKDTLEFVVAHEVAHQWWNAVVGSDSKRHPFVDEALANHSAILYFDRVHGKEAAEMQREVQLRLPYQISRLVGAKDRPVDLPTEQFDGMLEYAAMVYGKGALFFETMRERSGDSSHFGYLRDYYQRHQFTIATPEDLVGGLVRTSRDPQAAQAIADRWLRQTHGDEDIGEIQFTALAGYLLGPETVSGALARVLEVLDHKGAAELAKLAKNFFTDDGRLKEDIDYGEIVELVLSLMGESEHADSLGAMVDLLAQNPDLMASGNLRATIKQLAKITLGGDAKTEALIDIGDALLKLMED